MSQEQQEKSGSETLLGVWMKAATDFWGSMPNAWPAVFDAAKTTTTSQENSANRSQEVVDFFQKLWQATASALREPGTMDAVSRGVDTLPEIVLRMAKIGWEGYFHLQQQWLEKVGKIGEKAEAYEFDKLDQNAFKVWVETYEEDFRRFLKIPQLGLARVYQERVNRTLDRFNLYQLSTAEFLHVLYLPVEKSLQVMGEKLQELSEAGDLPEDFKDYYKMWIKTLEGHYMTLFKSPDYVQALNKTLNAMEDFMAAKQEVLTDLLKSLPVPTNQDMDELYKEVYLLKRRLREIEKGMGER